MSEKILAEDVPGLPPASALRSTSRWSTSSRPSNGVFPSDSTSRALAFFWLFVFSVAQVLSKALGVALFWTTSGGDAFSVYSSTTGAASFPAAFFFVKVLRRDFFLLGICERPPVERRGGNPRSLQS